MLYLYSRANFIVPLIRFDSNSSSSLNSEQFNLLIRLINQHTHFDLPSLIYLVSKVPKLLWSFDGLFLALFILERIKRVEIGVVYLSVWGFCGFRVSSLNWHSYCLNNCANSSVFNVNIFSKSSRIHSSCIHRLFLSHTSFLNHSFLNSQFFRFGWNLSTFECGDSGFYSKMNAADQWFVFYSFDIRDIH